MDICIDFDGTCVTHEYPDIGKDIGSISVLNKIVSNGHNLILFTMRSGVEEMEAVNWFIDNHIPLYGVNKNPSQHFWTKSPKAYAQLYIDDAALGCPLKYDPKISDRPFVDWVKIEEILKNMNIIK